jgi:REP element-mobilizing transposase RayT
MTTARSLLVDPGAPGFYHCISRCVRRAWLCGIDPYDGKSYEHRRAWVEQRLLELAEIFAVGVYAYAVMSNHVHVVLRIDPTTAATWTDAEVATRWVRLFPATVNGAPDEAGCRTKEQTLLGNADRLRTCRQRLGSLAWFMKALNEPIARRANREDACTGRFWQGRYTCQALLDDAAVLTCMSYVDLNPIRAGIAENLESSAHTSAVQRIEKVRSNPSMASLSLASINASTASAYLPITTQDYLDLIDWSARLTRVDKRGSVDADEPPILRKLGLTEPQWHHQMLGTETRYWRAIGTAQSLIEKAAAIGQSWLKGIGSAQLLMRRQAA